MEFFGVVFGLAAMLCWGLSDFFVVSPARKIGVSRTFIWNQISGLVLLALIFLAFGSYSQLTLPSILLIAATGVCGISGSYFFYKGLKVGNVSVITPIVAAWAVVTAAVSVIFLGETITLTQGIGAALAIGGTVIVSIKPGSKLAEGSPYAFLTLFAFGMQFVFLGLLGSQINFLEGLLFVRIFVTIAFAAFCLVRKEEMEFPGPSFNSVALIGVFEVLGFIAYGLGIAHSESALVAPVTGTHPLITIALAVILLKEKVTKSQLAGIACVIAGIVLLSL